MFGAGGFCQSRNLALGSFERVHGRLPVSPPAKQYTGHYWFFDRYSLGKCKRGRYVIPDTRVLVLIAAIAAFLLLQSSAVGAVEEVKRVLIFNIFEPLASPGVGLMDQAIVTGLKNSPYQIELYSENLEAGLFPDEAAQRQIRDWYIRKYRDHKPDVIITVGPASLRFMIELHERYPLILSFSSRCYREVWQVR